MITNLPNVQCVSFTVAFENVADGDVNLCEEGHLLASKFQTYFCTDVKMPWIPSPKLIRMWEWVWKFEARNFLVDGCLHETSGSMKPGLFQLLRYTLLHVASHITGGYMSMEGATVKSINNKTCFIQVKGSKLWRLYPLLNSRELTRHKMESWSQVNINRNQWYLQHCHLYNHFGRSWNHCLSIWHKVMLWSGCQGGSTRLRS